MLRFVCWNSPGEESFQKHSIPCDVRTLCILFQLNIWPPIRAWRSDADFSEAKRAYCRPAMLLSTWDEAPIPLKVPSVGRQALVESEDPNSAR
jgi:hypothetical protein